jgi:hypothetical protein
MLRFIDVGRSGVVNAKHRVSKLYMVEEQNVIVWINPDKVIVCN